MVTVSGAAVACSTMVMETVPAGTSKLTTLPTVCGPRSIAVAPETGATGLVQAGFAAGHVGA